MSTPSTNTSHSQILNHLRAIALHLAARVPTHDRRAFHEALRATVNGVGEGTRLADAITEEARFEQAQDALAAGFVLSLIGAA